MKTKFKPSQSNSKPVRLEPDSNPAFTRAPSPLPAYERIPTYDEIAARARVLWREKGCPVDRDEEIWLEAERELSAPPHESAADGGAGGIDPNGDATDPVDVRLDEMTQPAPNRSATSL